MRRRVAASRLKLHQFRDLHAYTAAAIEDVNSKELSVPRRYDIVLDILRYQKHCFPHLTDDPTINTNKENYWRAVEKKLREFAECGVRAVNVLWVYQWGPAPHINLNGQYAKLPVKNRPVKRALRRRRSACMLVLMRNGLPTELWRIVVDMAGL